ncbi:MAG: hypothetical protein DRG82_15280, partial [Deltaproteobacteria bacterium]
MDDKLKIMLIDDEPELLEVLSTALELKGLTTRQFCNPKEAVEAYNAEEFDAVIVDFKMPEMDGIEVLKLLREQDPNARVIILTGYSEVDNAIAALNNGAHAFFRKPPDIREILQALERIQQEKKLSKEITRKIQEVKQTFNLADSYPDRSEFKENIRERAIPLQKELKSLVDEIQAQAWKVKQLVFLNQKFQNTDNLELLCQEITSRALQVTSSDYAFLLLLDQRKLFCLGKNKKFIEFEIKNNLIQDPQLPFLQILRQGDILHLANYRLVQPSELLEAFPRIRNLLGIPMMIHDQALALLAVFNKDKNGYTDLDEFFLSHLASMGVTALNNVKTLLEMAKVNSELARTTEDLNLTYRELQEHVVIVDQIQAISREIHEGKDLQYIMRELVEYTHHLLDCDFSLIVFNDERLQRWYCYSNNNLLQAYFREGNYKILEALPFDVFSANGNELVDNKPSPEIKEALSQYGIKLSNYLTVPLVKDTHVLGMIAVFNKQASQG